MAFDYTYPCIRGEAAGRLTRDQLAAKASELGMTHAYVIDAIHFVRHRWRRDLVDVVVHIGYGDDLLKNGGLGSLAGCFIASIVIGMVQTFAVAVDGSLGDLLGPVVSWIGTDNLAGEILSIPISRVGPLLPYAMMVVMLVLSPRGLMGTRDT